MDYFKPVDLTQEDKDYYQQLMLDASPHLTSAAMHNYNILLDSSVTPGDRVRLRDDFHKGKKLNLSAEEKQFLVVLKESEEMIVRGWIKVADKLCRSFYFANRKSSTATLDDYHQEAVIKIYDCIYNFCQSDKQFSTLVYSSIKRCLINYSRECTALRGNRRDEIVVRNESAYSSDSDSRLTSVFDRCSQFDDNFDELDQLMYVIELTPLKDIERDLIMAYMREGHGSIAAFAEEYVSPRTGKRVTRQRMQQIFKSACDKAKEIYLEIDVESREAVAA